MSMSACGCHKPVGANTTATASGESISNINAVDVDTRHRIINASSIHENVKIYETLIAVIM